MMIRATPASRGSSRRGPSRPADFSRPSLAELRGRVQKQHHRAIGNVLARRWGRPTAVYGTWVAVRLGLSAHQVTVLAIVATLGSAIGYGTGSRGGFAAGVALGFLAFWLDHVDGQVARWRGTAGLTGVFLDYVMHHVQALAVGFGLGFGLARQSGDLAWTVAGALAGGGWLVLSLQNDCRYKAMFQRLKVPGAAYRVTTGSYARPSPAMGWPRTWPGVVSWPAAKLCEGHVVLIGLAMLSALSWVWPMGWLWAWRAGAAGMAVLAPSLALLRIGRLVRCDAVEREFRGWFEPVAGLGEGTANSPTGSKSSG